MPKTNCMAFSVKDSKSVECTVEVVAAIASANADGPPPALQSADKAL